MGLGASFSISTRPALDKRGRFGGAGAPHMQIWGSMGGVAEPTQKQTWHSIAFRRCNAKHQRRKSIKHVSKHSTWKHNNEHTYRKTSAPKRTHKQKQCIKQPSYGHWNKHTFLYASFSTKAMVTTKTCFNKNPTTPPTPTPPPPQPHLGPFLSRCLFLNASS